jgi:heme/copper-type cytochrome/quinol oxidase subunit 2
LGKGKREKEKGKREKIPYLMTLRIAIFYLPILIVFVSNIYLYRFFWAKKSVKKY